MAILSTTTRIATSVVGLVAALSLTVACSSTRNGTPVGGAGSAQGTSASVSGSVPSSAPTTAAVPTFPSPTAVPPSLTTTAAPTTSTASVPTGGSDAAFCAAIKAAGGSSGVPSDTTSQAGLKKIAAQWRRIAATAPASLKADANKVARFLQDAANGKLDPNAVQQLSPATQHVVQYYATHCTPD
jgi:hypothetical protein